MCLDSFAKSFVMILNKTALFEIWKMFCGEKKKKVNFLNKSEVAVLSIEKKEKNRIQFQKFSGKVQTKDRRSLGTQFWKKNNQNQKKHIHFWFLSLVGKKRQESSEELRSLCPVSLCPLFYSLVWNKVALTILQHGEGKERRITTRRKGGHLISRKVLRGIVTNATTYKWTEPAALSLRFFSLFNLFFVGQQSFFWNHHTCCFYQHKWCYFRNSNFLSQGTAVLSSHFFDPFLILKKKLIFLPHV